MHCCRTLNPFYCSHKSICHFDRCQLIANSCQFQQTDGDVALSSPLCNSHESFHTNTHTHTRPHSCVVAISKWIRTIPYMYIYLHSTHLVWARKYSNIGNLPIDFADTAIDASNTPAGPWAYVLRRLSRWRCRVGVADKPD